MKYRNLILTSTIIFAFTMILQSHADGRATRNRDNTGAPGGQGGGNGNQISCQNCHDNAAFEVGLNLELLDVDDNPITGYIPNEVYTAKVTIQTLSGNDPTDYGFQMVSLFDADDSDVNGWVEEAHSTNVQLVLANSTGRVYAEHNGASTSNEFTAEWTAPAENSGEVSFYVSGIGGNGNGASSGDHAATPIKITFPESAITSTSQIATELDLKIYPNPTSEYLNLTGDLGNKYIEIYRSESLVQAIKSDNTNLLLPLTSLNAGVYFIVIRDEDNRVVTTRKVIKK